MSGGWFYVKTARKELDLENVELSETEACSEADCVGSQISLEISCKNLISKARWGTRGAPTRIDEATSKQSSD